MKSLAFILLFSFISISLTAQTWSEHRAQKKLDRAEEKRIEAERPMDLKKVGKHLRNAGWSSLGSAISVPYAIMLHLDRRLQIREAAEDPNEEFEDENSFLTGTLTYSSLFFVFNTGAQLIKAGWELSKEVVKK